VPSTQAADINTKQHAQREAEEEGAQ
jgi:hypothetical protein